MIQNNNQSTINQRLPVLVRVCGDGFLEVYGPRHIDVKIVQEPKVSTALGERLADLHLLENLPYRYREIFFPGNRRAHDVIRPVTWKDLAHQCWELNVIKDLRELEQVAKEVQHD